jgi:hypothetical protein
MNEAYLKAQTALMAQMEQMGYQLIYIMPILLLLMGLRTLV